MNTVAEEMESPKKWSWLANLGGNDWGGSSRFRNKSAGCGAVNNKLDRSHGVG